MCTVIIIFSVVIILVYANNILEEKALFIDYFIVFRVENAYLNNCAYFDQKYYRIPIIIT